WVNWFKTDKLPSTLILDSTKGGASKTTSANETTLTYTIPYPYGGFPSNVLIYFKPHYQTNAPFALMTWITPDGRTFELGRATGTPGKYFDASSDLVSEHILIKQQKWLSWFVLEGNYPTPKVNLLFAKPDLDQPAVLSGTY